LHLRRAIGRHLRVFVADPRRQVLQYRQNLRGSDCLAYSRIKGVLRDQPDNELSTCERQAQLAYPSYLSGEIADKALEIFVKKIVMHKPLRSLGVRGCHLVPKDANIQLDLFTDQSRRERLETLEYAMDDLRRRYGYQIVQRGILFEDRKLTGINPKEHTIHPINFLDGSISTDYALKHSA
jgi:hypothetical protein